MGYRGHAVEDTISGLSCEARFQGESWDKEDIILHHWGESRERGRNIEGVHYSLVLQNSPPPTRSCSA